MFFLNLNAFNVVENKLEEYFLKNNFNKKRLGECNTVFFDKEKTYKLEYSFDKKQFKLLYAEKSIDDLNNEDFKQISVWLFDPNEDTEKEAKSIANDFIESLSFNKIKSSNKKNYKSNNQSDTGDHDLLFFINRLATIFPELKDDIKYEKENFSEFRGVKFCREKVLPLILNLLRENTQKDKIKKLCTLFNNSYEDGNLDVRACTTIVFLNYIEDEKSIKILKKGLNDELNLAWNAALKYKDKKVKPEKVKNKTNLFELAQKRLDG